MNMSILSESVIFYRSQFERDREQFFYENPEYALFIFLTAIVAIGICAIYKIIK